MVGSEGNGETGGIGGIEDSEGSEDGDRGGRGEQGGAHGARGFTGTQEDIGGHRRQVAPGAKGVKARAGYIPLLDFTSLKSKQHLNLYCNFGCHLDP